MATEQQPTPKLVKAEENAREAKRVLQTTIPLLVDRLLIVTGGDVNVTYELMQDIANVAGRVGNLAVANRRVSAAKYETEHQELHPDNLTPRQESGNFGSEAAQPVIVSLDEIHVRAKIVAEGKSPVQKPDPEII